MGDLSRRRRLVVSFGSVWAKTWIALALSNPPECESDSPATTFSATLCCDRRRQMSDVAMTPGAVDVELPEDTRPATSADQATNPEPAEIQMTGPAVKVVVGPVVGKVTDTEARILLETEEEGMVKLVIKAEGSDTPLDIPPKTFQCFRPNAFAVDGLIPATKYMVSFENIQNESAHRGSFTTLPADVTQLTVLSGSCDHLKNRGSVDMWTKILEEYVRPGKMDMMIHNGDQVYADSAFKAGKKFWEENEASKSEEELIARTTEFYAEIYRKTWNHPPCKEVLANTSNLMLWDDHELRNDWGAFDKDRDKSSVNYKLGLAARRAYWLYQRQLWDDMDNLGEKEATVDKDGHCVLMPGNHIGIAFVDCRGGRSFYASVDGEKSERPFMSMPQWNMMADALSPEGLYKDAKRLLIVHTMPAVLVGSSCSAACPCIVGGKDKMGFGVYPQEQEDYLSLINDWVNVHAPSNSREVLLLGGDLHFSMQSVVTRKSDNKKVLRQVVTSAISNKPPCLWQYYPMKWIASCCPRLGHGTYQYQHLETQPVQNFGVFNINLKDDIGVTVETAHAICCNTRGFCYC